MPREIGGQSVARFEYSPKQVIHSPLQVLSPDQLKVGEQYHDYSTLGQKDAQKRGEEYKPETLVVLSAPEINSRGFLSVRGQEILASGIQLINETVSLADRGIVAYQDGSWNLYNWLERIPQEETSTSTAD